jgi:hypothetical protein
MSSMPTVCTFYHNIGRMEMISFDGSAAWSKGGHAGILAFHNLPDLRSLSLPVGNLAQKPFLDDLGT